MFETQGNVDHAAIMRRAHQMRAEVVADLARSILGLFRRKASVKSQAV